MKEIPIQNIWWLMLYASELRVHTKSNKFRKEENPDEIPELIAKILIRAIKRRLLRNLSVEFQNAQEDLTRVRGCIDHIRTERHFLLEQGKIACLFDHFTTDTPIHRYVKAALCRLTRFIKDKELKRKCRIYSDALEKAGVARHVSHNYIISTGHMLYTMASKSPEDRQMLAAAMLVFNMKIPTEKEGSSYLPITDRNKEWLRKLFEKAIWGFYDMVLPHSEWCVRHGKRICWPCKNPTGGISDILPDMQTDIVLKNKENRAKIIIDTKFTEILAMNNYGKTRLKSNHIFQLYAYLRSQEVDELSTTTSGILLYPSVGVNVDESVTIQGHRIRFATVDLAADNADIRKTLLELIPSKRMIGAEGASCTNNPSPYRQSSL